MNAWSEFFAAMDAGDDDAIIALITSARILVNELPDDGSPLINAANFGMDSLVVRMIELGANVNLAMPGCLIVPIHAAAAQNHTSTIRLLLDHGADVHAKAGVAISSQAFYAPHSGETALHLAAAYGDCESIKVLLRAGADRHALRF